MPGANRSTRYTLKLLPFDEEQVEEISQREALAHSRPWRQSHLLQSVRQGHDCFICAVGERSVGFCILRRIPDVIELLHIVVFRPYQGLGYGSAMLSRISDWAVKENLEEIWLEVRQSNHIAKIMYTKHGFFVDAVREGYYVGDCGPEAAVLMRKIIRKKITT